MSTFNIMLLSWMLSVKQIENADSNCSLLHINGQPSFYSRSRSKKAIYIDPFLFWDVI